MKRGRLRAAYLSLAIVAAAATAVGWQLWFSPWHFTSATGVGIVVERSCGCVRRISYDEDRNGSPELVARYDGCLRKLPGHGVSPAESWIDEGGLGTFNLHFEYERGRGAIRARRDTDRDGTFELDLSGEAAGAFEKQWRQETRKGILGGDPR